MQASRTGVLVSSEANTRLAIGVIASNNGSPITSPAPRRTVRRSMRVVLCVQVMVFLSQLLGQRLFCD
jgi:hypothetical protein